MTTATKITYTSASGNLDEFHRFDVGLAAVRATAGREHPAPSPIGAVTGTGQPLEDRSPIDTRILPRFSWPARPSWTRRLAARAAQRDWSRRPWGERSRCFAGRPS